MSKDLAARVRLAIPEVPRHHREAVSEMYTAYHEAIRERDNLIEDLRDAVLDYHLLLGKLERLMRKHDEAQ